MDFIWDVITHPCHNFNDVLINIIEFTAWMSNCIPLFYMDVITYPCPNLNAGLVNLFVKGGPAVN